MELFAISSLVCGYGKDTICTMCHSFLKDYVELFAIFLPHTHPFICRSLLNILFVASCIASFLICSLARVCVQKNWEGVRISCCAHHIGMQIIHCARTLRSSLLILRTFFRILCLVTSIVEVSFNLIFFCNPWIINIV